MLRRYTLPIPTAKDSLLAKYGHELLNEARETLRRLPDGHRSEAVDCKLLPEPSARLLSRAMRVSTPLRTALVYRRCCSSYTSPL